jgi:hypothetical protein
LFIQTFESVKGINEKLECIPSNEEKYISFSEEVIVDKFTNKKGTKVVVKRDLRFIDSFRFMPPGLDALSKNLTDKQCCEMARHYGERSEPRVGKFQLLRKEGVYLYENMDCIDRLSETELPPKEAFYSYLNGANITNDNMSTQRTYVMYSTVKQ